MTGGVLVVTPYPPHESERGGGAWVDSRLVRSLVGAGADVEIRSVTGPSEGWEHDGVHGGAAGDLPLEVRGDRRALARVVGEMLRSTRPYQAAKFTAFPGWDAAVAGLREAARGRRVVTSGWPPLLLATAAGVPVDVHVVHNVDTLIAETHAPRPLRLLGEVPRLRRLERELVGRPRALLSLSRLDVDRLAAWGRPAAALPLPLEPVPSTPPDRPTVGFIGKAGWPPNAEALATLLGPVHEQLDRLGRDVRFVLGGSGTAEMADHPRVDAAGWVADLDDYYDSIAVAVVPRLGVSTGVSVKMLEAAEHGVPVVVPRSLADAVDPDGPWVVADDPAALAAAVVDALGGDFAAARASTRAWAEAHDPAATAAAILDRL